MRERFKTVWFVDFEFRGGPGDAPKVVCMVARELHTGKTIKLWEDELLGAVRPPFEIGMDSLIVAYYASAEMSCHLSLGWEMPQNVLDLFTEFRVLTNGLSLPCGSGLLGALAYFGLDAMAGAEKDRMRDLILRGRPWSNEEKKEILDYCESDVLALERLLSKIEPVLDGDRSLLRGRYMKAVASMEVSGIPVDVQSLEKLRRYWEPIRQKLILKIDARYGVYEGVTFKARKFADYLANNNVPWPVLSSGSLALDDDTFREMAKAHPMIAPLHELRASISKMRLSDLSVGFDGRNRCMLSAFRSRTGRNQPSNAQFCFGPAVWVRSVIQPRPGYGLAYIDWSQQEFGIAAALSKDEKMMDAYLSGDPYLAFAKQAGAVPESGTKKSHKAAREQFKQCVLAVQYGMGEISLAARIGKSPARARELLHLHRSTYPTFWKWSDAVVDCANLKNSIFTVFGWRLTIQDRPNERSLRNFPMQANGAEMLRLACIFATEAGVRVCAPVHDAILIEAPLLTLDREIARTQELMSRASAIVLGGFALRSDANVIRWPDRYADERGTDMWKAVWEIIGELEASDVAGSVVPT